MPPLQVADQHNRFAFDDNLVVLVRAHRAAGDDRLVWTDSEDLDGRRHRVAQVDRQSASTSILPVGSRKGSRPEMQILLGGFSRSSTPK